MARSPVQAEAACTRLNHNTSICRASGIGETVDNKLPQFSPALTQFNHNAPRIDYRQEPVAFIRAGAVGSLQRAVTFDPSNGELPVRPRTSSCVGSRVDNLRWSYTQDSVDFTSRFAFGMGMATKPVLSESGSCVSHHGVAQGEPV